MAVEEAGVDVVIGDLLQLAACDVVGVELIDAHLGGAVAVLDGHGLGKLEIYLAVPAVGLEIHDLGVGKVGVEGVEAAVDYLAEGVSVAGDILGVVGVSQRVEAAVIEAVGLDYIAAVDRTDAAGGRIVAQKGALCAAGVAAAEVHLAVVKTYVV